jgi:hypothetical protein
MSIFNTTANTQFNSFGDPLNPMNMNRGGWGMDPNYLTPNYSAPYRPPYSGFQGNQSGMQNPGFFRSMGGLSPWDSGVPYGVGTADQNSRYWDSISGKPADAIVGGAQRFAVPVAAFAGAYGIGRMWQVANQSNMARRAMFAGNYLTGGGFRESIMGASTVSGFTGMGQRFGGGIARGLMSQTPGFAASGAGAFAADAAGALGGVAGGLVLPALLAQAGIKTADELIFNNYIGVRENQNLLRSAFKNVTFGGAAGDRYTGQGLSRRSAAQMGTELTAFGAKDQVFDQREVSTITSMASQMGMLDNVGSDQITGRMKSIVRQLKLVMSVVGTTDFKEAMEMMARLHSAGVSPGGMQSVMSGIGGMASVAGISSARMMNTVGAQGQYLFQSNGMTPYLGQLASAGAMGGIASAYRTGLVSNDLMARLGGVEGATQLSVTGQVNAGQSTYNMMRAFNRFGTGAGGNSVMSNVSNFGRAMSADPLEAYGAMTLNRGRHLSEQFKQDGPMGLHDQLMEIAGNTPGAMRNGRLSANTAGAIATSMMGLSADEFNSWFMQYQSSRDPRSRNQMMSGLRSNEIKVTRDYLEQSGQTYFASKVSPITGAWRSLSAGAAKVIGGGVGAGSGIFDMIASGFESATTGSPEQIGGLNLGSFRESQGSKLIDLGSLSAGPGGGMSGDYEIMKKLNDLARSGDADAIKALGSGKGASNGIWALANRGAIDKSYMSGNAHSELLSTLAGTARSGDVDISKQIMDQVYVKLHTNPGMFGNDVNDVDRMRSLAAAQRIQEKMSEGKGEDLLSSGDKSVQSDIALLKRTSGQGIEDMAGLSGVTQNMVSMALKKRLSTSSNIDMYKGNDLEGLLKSGYISAVEAGEVHSNSQVDYDTKLEFRKRVNAIRSQQGQITRMAQEGRIDASSYYGMSAGLQMSEAAADFKDAVGEFKGAVKGIPGYKEVTPTNTSRTPPMLPNITLGN